MHQLLLPRCTRLTRRPSAIGPSGVASAYGIHGAETTSIPGAYHIPAAGTTGVHGATNITHDNDHTRHNSIACSDHVRA